MTRSMTNGDTIWDRPSPQKEKSELKKCRTANRRKFCFRKVFNSKKKFLNSLASFGNQTASGYRYSRRSDNHSSFILIIQFGHTVMKIKKKSLKFLFSTIIKIFWNFPERYQQHIRAYWFQNERSLWKMCWSNSYYLLLNYLLYYPLNEL